LETAGCLNLRFNIKLCDETMKRAEFNWTSEAGWVGLPEADFAPDLVLYFGSRLVLTDHHVFDTLKGRFPQAIVLGASGGGQIHRGGIIDDGVTGPFSLNIPPSGWQNP
jgi:hypothetical protein